MTFNQVLQRKTAAFALTMIAVAVPCSAWYVAGSRQIAHEAKLQKDTAYAQGFKQAFKFAERLATRLEVLRTAESRRPFYHYQNLFHDPKGASQGIAVSLSPLAQGATDPLIEAYFQVDDRGHLSLPTLNDEFPELSLESAESQHCSLLEKLRDVSVFFEDSTVSRLREPAEAQIELLDLRAWRQHLRANDLYARIKYPSRQQDPSLLPSNGASEPQVEVAMGPLEWQILPLSGQPALVALRRLQTPAGSWLQGFLVSRAAVDQMLESSELRGVLAAQSPEAPYMEPIRADGKVVADVDRTGFAIEIDIERELAAADARSAEQRARFLRGFAGGTLAAGLAGVLLIALVFQSERLAQQRIRFAASAAHELRTPLAGLRLYGEMLAEGLGDPSRAREYARRMAGEAERLGRVVTNVLSFTRLERGGLTVHPQIGDLGPAVEAAIERQRPALEQAGMALEVRLDEGLPAVLFDRDAVGPIVQNLLDNAEKYTREIDDRQVTVHLAARPAEAPTRVVLEVADNGKGIGPRLRRRLFEPFSRGNDADGPEGLGLGLVLVKTLVEAQRAEICYEDAPGGGALFRVSFPTAAAT